MRAQERLWLDLADAHFVELMVPDIEYWYVHWDGFLHEHESQAITLKYQETRIINCMYDNAHWKIIWAVACDFYQSGILTCVDSDEPLQPSVKLRNSKWCLVSSLTTVEYSSD